MGVGTGREFLFYESAVQRALATFFHPSQVEPEGVPRIKAMPFPAYTAAVFVKIVKTFLGTFLVLTYLYTALSITRGLVEEKQARLKEAMMMMGNNNPTHLPSFGACSHTTTSSRMVLGLTDSGWPQV